MGKPFMVDWALTGKCNLNCRHCRGMPEEELATEVAMSVAQEIAELEPGWIIIEGGEPLLRDRLWDILNILHNNGLDVNLITNGMLLNSDNMKRFKELNIKVMLSLDSPYPDVYEQIREGAKFEQVIRNGERLANMGILHSLNFALSKANYKSIKEMFYLCKSIGGAMINILGLKPCEKYEEQLLSGEEYRMAILLACDSARDTGISFFFDEPFFWACVEEWNVEIPLPQKESKILVPETSGCIFGSYLFIEPNGDIKPCTFAPYVMGNARDRVKRGWEFMQGSNFLMNIKSPETRIGYCRTCKYLLQCKGCRSRAYALTNDWFASDPVCPLSNG